MLRRRRIRNLIAALGAWLLAPLTPATLVITDEQIRDILQADRDR